MDTATFNSVIEDQIQISKDLLLKKSNEYATEDRLHNFHSAAVLENGTPEQALAGMMAKHVISIFDMCTLGKEYPLGVWEEKISDNINYLLLLKAIVIEKKCPPLKEVAIKNVSFNTINNVVETERYDAKDPPGNIISDRGYTNTFNMENFKKDSDYR